MKIIMAGRKTGKTSLLINLAAEAEAKGEVCYIVCRSHEQAYRIAQRAKEQGLNIGFPITFDEFIGNRYARNNIEKFFIDNADHLLQALTNVEIAAITVEREPDDKTT
jgi:hypothetical protein